MGAESSIPVQVFQRLSKGKLFGEVETSFDDLALAMGTPTVFAPFTGAAGEADKALESGVAAERDLMLMEHLPTVRYLARRIHERLPQHVELDDLVSAEWLV